MNRLFTILTLTLMLGCATKRTAVAPAPLPPLPAGYEQGLSSMVEEVPPVGKERIGLAWDNPPAVGDIFVTGLEGTTNFHDWYELARQPYGAGGPVIVWLTNRPPFEFYRAFNAIAP